MRYIALLRGVNVGGHIVKMARLRELFGKLGFANVGTYIQSGNVFFESPNGDRTALLHLIEKRLQAAFGFAIPVCLRTVEEFEAIISSDPFKDIELTPDRRFCICFAAHTIPSLGDLPKESPKGDITIVGATPHEAFVVWRIINGRPPANGTFLDNALGGQTTSRFFHTSQKILAAAQAM